MFEDTNQTKETMENGSIEDLTGFESSFLEEEENVSEIEENAAEGARKESETELPGEQEPKEEAADTNATNREEFVPLTYIGKEIPLPKEAVMQAAQALGMTEQEVIATMQKGMNYDHLQQKLEKNPEREVLDWYAKQNGMDRAAYVKMLNDKKEEMLLEQEKERLVNQFPDSDEELLRMVAQNNLQRKQAEEQQRAVDQLKQEAEARRKPWLEFFKFYPQMEVKDIPPTVIEAVNKGETPISAMLRLEKEQLQKQIAELQKQVEVKNKNESNKNKAIGSVATEAAAPTGEEALFMAGFNEF